MARIINQNNEVVGVKTNKDNNKKKEKTAISRTSIIVGSVLFVALLTVIIVLIVVFTKKSAEKEEHIPTQLEQYVEDYKKNCKGKEKIRILKELYVQDVAKCKGECYVLVYDTTWMENYESTSQVYEAYTSLDAVLTGGIDHKGNQKASFLDAVLNCGQDISVFIIDYSTIKVDEQSADAQGENAPHFNCYDPNGGDGERCNIIGSPEFYHVNFKDKDGEFQTVERLYAAKTTDGKEELVQKLFNKITGEINRLNGLASKN